jgi:hypothetical protein
LGCATIPAQSQLKCISGGLGANASGVPMAHVLAAIRHAKRPFYIQWQAAVIGFGIAASFAWIAVLGYAAIALVKSFAH